MGKKIDIRVLKLNKWYVPKTGVLKDQSNYIAVGYFDEVQIKEVQQGESSEHPFLKGYNEIASWKQRDKRELVDYSSQEQMLFTNICANKESESGLCFSEDTINHFWEYKQTPYLFLSMLHINHTGNLRSVLEKIKEVFADHFLSYISFDYCDIILFAKNLKIKDFFEKVRMIFQLNQNQERNVILDSFSLVSFYPSYALQQSQYKFKEDYEGDEFQATINLSIKDYNDFQKWYDKVTSKFANIIKYDMLGRHDISIVNARADTGWLMYIMNELHKKENQKLFWSFETYIKIQNKDSDVILSEDQTTEKVYKTVCRELNRLIDKLREVVSKTGQINEYRIVLPACEVRDCICSIVKNNFAEEFIYCMYESFRHFIDYFTEKIKFLIENGENPGKIEEEIAESYDAYFTALNTLVNSTMHNERQFIQATAFNAIFYSVPPKIMAFYNAYIYRIKQILSDEIGENEYTFLISPSFATNMSVEEISPEDIPPCDRILLVKINERTLYDVIFLSYQLVHELAHYIGNGVRCREIRKTEIFSTLLVFIEGTCGIQDSVTVDILDTYLNENWFCKKKNGYIQELSIEFQDFLHCLINDTEGEIQNLFEKYTEKNPAYAESGYDDMLSAVGMEEEGSQKIYQQYFKEQYYYQKYTLFKSKVKIIQDTDKLDIWMALTILIESVYRESYADLQMVLVMAVNPEDYLNMFIQKHEIATEELLCAPDDLIRISVIMKIMMDSGIWDMSMFREGLLKGFAENILFQTNKLFKETKESRGKMDNAVAVLLQEIKEDVDKYKKDVETTIGFRSGLSGAALDNRYKHANNIPIDVQGLIEYEVYEYLLYVLKASLKEYWKDEKRERIIEVRKIIKEIFEFKDIADVFDRIEDELHNYKGVLFGEF